MMNKKFDIVVIGAGNAGLTAAVNAQLAGYKTLLIEQHNLPGGFATSFIRGKFEFEVALHELGNYGNLHQKGDIYDLFEKLGIKLNWCEIKDAFRVIVKQDGIDVDYTLPFGVEEFAQACEQISPGCYEKVIQFIEICENCYYAVKYIKSTKGKPDSAILKTEYPNYLTCSVYTVQDVLDKLKMPKIISFIIGVYWTYLGITPAKINMSLFGVMFYEYIKFKAYIPEHRSHEISQKLVTRFQELGGEIYYNTKATKISIENNQVTGVQTTNGYIETNHIISNASPHLVYGQMIDTNQIPEIDKKVIANRQLGSQGFCIYLGLNKSIEELGLKDYSYFMYTSLEHDKIYHEMDSLETNNSYIVVALNIANPNCSPKGTSIVSFTTLYNDAWNDVNEHNYFQIKEMIAKKFITDFERKMNIKITPYIEEIEVATPITFARYTGSANGAIYGYPSHLVDSTYVRARNMDSFYTIKGLRFCGGNGVTSHGYSITYISGDIISGKTISDIKSKE